MQKFLASGFRTRIEKLQEDSHLFHTKPLPFRQAILFTFHPTTIVSLPNRCSSCYGVHPQQLVIILVVDLLLRCWLWGVLERRVGAMSPSTVPFGCGQASQPRCPAHVQLPGSLVARHVWSVLAPFADLVLGLACVLEDVFVRNVAPFGVLESLVERLLLHGRRLGGTRAGVRLVAVFLEEVKHGGRRFSLKVEEMLLSSSLGGDAGFYLARFSETRDAVGDSDQSQLPDTSWDWDFPSLGCGGAAVDDTL